MDEETAVNLKRSYFTLLDQIEEQRKALIEEDIESYLTIANRRESEMERIDLLVGHPGSNWESGSLVSRFSSTDIAELRTLLSRVIELDRHNGLALTRLVSVARSEMDNMRDSRAMLHGYARALGREESLAFDEKI